MRIPLMTIQIAIQGIPCGLLVLGSVIEGMAYTAEPNPSQATFVYDAGAWTLLAYANFNKPS